MTATSIPDSTIGRSAVWSITVLPLYTSTIFLGALLVFGVQPIAARLLLPSFGGSPAVWSATSVFFQLALLAGYGYSFIVTRTLSARRQPLIHLAVLLIPLVFLPLSLAIGPSAQSSSAPALDVIRILTIGLAVPFVVASTTGPLLQRWFSFAGHPSGSDPYFLYAASNAGSLLVLLAYPFLIEPRFTLGEQSTLWGYGYVAFAVLSATCGAVVLARMRGSRAVPRTDLDVMNGDSEASVTWGRRLRWIVLGAVPAALSLATTQHISTDIAAVPLLWIAPLAIYLASFVVAFSRRNPLTSRRCAAILPIPAAAAVAIPFINPPIGVAICVSLALLFVASVMCHTLLAEDRPHTLQLTEYYLLLSVGGAIGGLFVSLIAPTVFDSVLEYPIAIGAALLLRVRPRAPLTRRRLMTLVIVVLIATVVIAVPMIIVRFEASWMAWAALATILVTVSRWRLPFAIGVALVLGGVAFGGGGIHTERTFFGVYRVTDREGEHALVNGTTVHGIQNIDPELRRTATTYYHRTGPIGQVFETRASELDRVAVIGLGIGTLATYGLPHQHFTFYEIDPAVVAIARDPNLFTYLTDTHADVDVIVGDGRLGLAADPNDYDLLVMDAFTSDAVPVHLMTSEALEIYVQRLAPGGIMAFHITNRHLELKPVLGTVARSLGLFAIAQSDAFLTADEIAERKEPSSWVLIARSNKDLEPFVADSRWTAAAFDPHARPWSDDFSDILGAVR